MPGFHFPFPSSFESATAPSFSPFFVRTSISGVTRSCRFYFRFHLIFIFIFILVLISMFVCYWQHTCSNALRTLR